MITYHYPVTEQEQTVPDGDVIRRGVRFAWRPAYEALRGGGSDVDAKGQIARCLTHSLKTRGIPQLREAANLVEGAWSGQISSAEAMRQVASVSGSVGGTRDASLLDTAVRRVLAAGPTGARGDQAVAEEYCQTVMDAELWAKLRPAMLEDALHTPSEVEEIIANWTVVADEPVRRLAQQLIVDPTGVQLRSPPTLRRRKRATVDLLDESV